MLYNHAVKSEKGFAMIEALVTALIVAIGISGVGVLLIRAIQGTQDSAQQSQAMWIVQDFVGRMRANTIAAKTGDYVVDANIDCDTLPSAMCAAYFDTGISTSANTNDCTATEMATYDKWITVCSIHDGVFDSPSDFMVSPALTSTCSLSDITTGECIQYNIQLDWVTKLTKGSTIEAERTNSNSYSMIVEVN